MVAKFISSFLLRLLKKGKIMDVGFNIFKNTVNHFLTQEYNNKIQIIQISASDRAQIYFLIFSVQMMKCRYGRVHN